jgi:hypothetical protein
LIFINKESFIAYLRRLCEHLFCFVFSGCHHTKALKLEQQ